MNKQDALLWLCIFTGPALWFVSLEGNFALAPWACAFGWKPALFAVSSVCLLLTCIAGYYSWGEWQRLKPQEQQTRPRAMAFSGVVLSAAFVLVILAQSIPNIILGSCE